MTELIAKLIPLGVLLSHALFVFLILALVFKNSWGGTIVSFLKRRGIELGLLVSALTFLGSVFYSAVIGYAPCELCWWQRAMLFPTLVIFIVAWKGRRRSAFSYVLSLAAIAGLIALYQIYAQSGGTSFLDCTAAGGACLKVYVKAYRYITIPVMSLTSAAYLALISIVNRKDE